MIPAEPARHRFRWWSGFAWGVGVTLLVIYLPLVTVAEIAVAGVMLAWGVMIVVRWRAGCRG